MLICSGSPLCNGRYGRPRGVSLRLRWQLRKGRAEAEPHCSCGSTVLYIQEVPVPSHGRWCMRSSRIPPQNRARHGKERVSRLGHMRDAWLLLRTIGRPGGCREHGTRASICFCLPSSLGRAAPRPCSRWPSALEDPCRVWSWDELG